MINLCIQSICHKELSLTPLNLQPKQLGSMLDEDPAIMERRTALAKRLELYRSAQMEIDDVAWSK